jgi:hypothetical protein
MNEFATLTQKKENYKKRLNLCHLSNRLCGGRSLEGAEESAPALGGGIEALAAGVEEIGVEVEEAAEGVIIDTMPGAYFFTFSKKPSSFERGRAPEELTFSQFTSSPCD